MASSKENDNIGKKIAKKYIRALQTKPLLTKSCTSAVMAGLGNIIAQKSTKGHVEFNSVFAYSATGLMYVGPTMHFFYRWLEKNIPSGTKWAALKRIILDRYILAPPWLLVYFYVLSILEGLGHKGAMKKIQDTYWEILKTNWKVWTVFQFVNVNYVPQQAYIFYNSFCNVEIQLLSLLSTLSPSIEGYLSLCVGILEPFNTQEKKGFRVLFASMLAFFWNIYVAYARK